MALWDRRPRFTVATAKKAPSLTAAGMKIQRQQSEALRRIVQQWQARSFVYYDAVPEVKYSAQFYSRGLAPLRLFAGMKNEQGELKEIEDMNHDAVKMLERIQDPGGGRAGLQGAYGRLMFIAGEAQLFVSIDKDTGEEQWEMLSTAELRATDNGYERRRAPSLMGETYEEASDDFEPIGDSKAVAYRLWRRHPLYSMLADSTMQGVLDVCEELILLTKAIRSRARSRLAGRGILLINGKYLPLNPDAEGEDEDAENDPFLAELIESIVTPIQDEGSANAMVPMLVRIETDHIDEVMKHIELFDSTQLYPEVGMRREAVERLAIGLDLPPEELLGMGNTNHWTGWQIDETKWKSHLQPVAQQLVDDLSSAYFRPALREAGVKEWQLYAIGYDAAAVVNHPDKGKDAKDVHDRGALSDEALRDSTGFDETDAPSDEERQVWLGVKLRDASVALNGVASTNGAGAPDEPGTTEPGDAPNETEKAPPEEPTDPVEPGATLASANGHGQVLAARIMGACDLTLHRVRELAGNRLRNHAKRDKEASKLIDGVKAAQVPHTLGMERAKTIGAPEPRVLVAGAAALLAETMRQWRVPDRVAEQLGGKIEQHAARTLYSGEPIGLPASFENYVLGLEVVPR